MYYFGNYRVVAKMFCKSVKAVLADTKVVGKKYLVLEVDDGTSR